MVSYGQTFVCVCVCVCKKQIYSGKQFSGFVFLSVSLFRFCFSLQPIFCFCFLANFSLKKRNIEHRSPPKKTLAFQSKIFVPNVQFAPTSPPLSLLLFLQIFFLFLFHFHFTHFFLSSILYHFFFTSLSFLNHHYHLSLHLSHLCFVVCFRFLVTHVLSVFISL